MTAPSLVTVLVPSYRHADYIVQRIQTITEQTRQDFDLVVIDDHSDDGSHDVLLQLSTQYGFRYIRNGANSGSPFSAWAWAAANVNTPFIWICESDDFAEPTFLEQAVKAMSEDPLAVLFYCNSNVVDSKGVVCGHTSAYFQDVWHEQRWRNDFRAEGPAEAQGFQVRGQTVPNMSSALIKTSAFVKSNSQFLERLKLTGDWLFIGEVMRHGAVLFSSATLSNFRQHPNTARIRVDSSLSQAEFILVKHKLHRSLGMPINTLLQTLSSDAIRFAHEEPAWYHIVGRAFSVSWLQSLLCAFDVIRALVLEPELVSKFRARLQLARTLKRTSESPKI